MEGVVGALENFIDDERIQGRKPVFVRFFLSDAQNQAVELRAALKEAAGRIGEEIPFSVVEQPPLDGSRIAALARTSDEAGSFLFHSVRLTEDEAAGKDSYTQAKLLFDKYLRIIRPLGLDLRTHCIRTWIYVRDIDSNYAGLVKARNDVFAGEGLSSDTHFIASTGIGGASDVRSAVVAIDFLTCPDISEDDKTYLKAYSHLSPTHLYGVAFERGTVVRGHVYVSGTASIDHKGRIVFEGDVLRQADRLLENIGALLEEASSGPQGRGAAVPEASLGGYVSEVPYLVVYLRDISDYPKVEAYLSERFPHIPRLILEARVCRPGWLIEMECEKGRDK